MNTYPTPSPKLFRRTGLLLIAIVGLCLALVSSVNAANGYYYGLWDVTLSFPNDEPLVELTTEIWYNPANGNPPYLVATDIETLVCTVTGTLQVNNEIATFTGAEYIACDQPNMADKFYEVSNGILLSGTSASARQPFVGGQIFVQGTNPSAILPVFYHPSIQHGMKRVSPTQAQQVFKVDNASSISSSFVQGLPFDLLAEFRMRPNGTYQTRFTANGVTTPGTPATVGGGLMISHAETTIYFGHSPVDNSYFIGDIKTVIADPGLFGRD